MAVVRADYGAEFRRVFPGEALSTELVARALASYVRLSCSSGGRSVPGAMRGLCLRMRSFTIRVLRGGRDGSRIKGGSGDGCGGGLGGRSKRPRFGRWLGLGLRWPLGVTDGEKADLAAFLRSLSGMFGRGGECLAVG